ncbi:MAG: calcium/sodium antiporter [Rhodospirillales bacterium]|nr:calcium/sodium antiporter [Rhodospirillales bacterium]
MLVAEVIAGFALLLIGAEALVRGSVAVARQLGVSTFLIGMTVVAFGTSMPELVVCLQAALSGAPGIAVGNVVGSNIANVLLIVGFTAICRPIAMASKCNYLDAVALVAGTLLFSLLTAGGTIERWGGGILLLAFLVFMAGSLVRQRQGSKSVAAIGFQQEVEDIEEVKEKPLRSWLFAVTGLAAVLFGADRLVEGSVGLAREFGVSEAVIGLTLVALGTSVPELAASVVAGIRGHVDIAVGNVLGSNLFNVLFVAGTVAGVVPIEVDEQILVFDIWVLLASTAVFLPVLYCVRFGRWGGIAFLALYAAYIAAQAYGVDKLISSAT